MMKKMSFKIVISTFIIVTLSALLPANMRANGTGSFKDSVGIKTIAGKKFIVHKIEKGESFYSIAKKYHVTVKELEDANPDLSGTIIAGKILFVPYKESFYGEEPPVLVESNKKKPVDTVKPILKPVDTIKTVAKTNDTIKTVAKPIDTTKKADNVPLEVFRAPKSDSDATAQIKHTAVVSAPIKYTVQPGDYLGLLASKYNTYVSYIMKWNNLSNDRINIGQVLIVGYSESSTPTKGDEIKKDTIIAPKKAEDTQTYSNDYVKFNTSNKPMKDFQEKGVASWIDDQDVNPKKYFALHKTAPIGTIIKVTNPMNNRYVFVKVVGTLPDTGDNTNIIIKISRASASKLEILDAHFQCILDYATNQY